MQDNFVRSKYMRLKSFCTAFVFDLRVSSAVALYLHVDACLAAALASGDVFADVEWPACVRG